MPLLVSFSYSQYSNCKRCGQNFKDGVCAIAVIYLFVLFFVLEEDTTFKTRFCFRNFHSKNKQSEER